MSLPVELVKIRYINEVNMAVPLPQKIPTGCGNDKQTDVDLAARATQIQHVGMADGNCENDLREDATMNGVHAGGYINKALDRSQASLDQNLTTHGQEELTVDNHDGMTRKEAYVTIPLPSTDGDRTEDKDAVPSPRSSCRIISRLQHSLSVRWRDNRIILKRCICILCLLLYLAYFGYAMYFRFGDEGSIRLLWMTLAAATGYVASTIGSRQGDEIRRKCRPVSAFVESHDTAINRAAVGAIIISIVVFLIVDVLLVARNPYNLVSASGIAFYIIIFILFSKHPDQVSWQAIFWGFCLQFIFAILIIRTNFGCSIFQWLGDRVTNYFLFADAGSKFVFGDKFTDHFFVFKVMPTVVFFSTTVSVLYHLGVMQKVISVVSSVMQSTMGTTAGESLTAAANIFIGMSEAPLLIRPMLNDLTKSELHAVMAGGFATVTGGIMAAYVLLGVPPNHLISASVMSAPAALAMSKLIYPETEQSKTTLKHLKKILNEKQEGSVLDALSNGALASIKIVSGVVVNLIAIIATLHFFNSALSWFGERVGHEELSFQLICSYLLWPVALVMGVDVADCGKVAQLLGIKMVLNEFIAYEQLSVYIRNERMLRDHVINSNGSWFLDPSDTIHLVNFTGNETLLHGGFITDRSIVISTYALCGFSNIGSLGIVIGVFTSMAPNRKSDVASVVVSAMLTGTVACFITACVAGLFYQT